jgi:hypothetical protein
MMPRLPLSLVAESTKTDAGSSGLFELTFVTISTNYIMYPRISCALIWVTYADLYVDLHAGD